MRRNTYSLILPSNKRRCHSISSLNLNHQSSHHIVQSALHTCLSQNIFDDDFDNFNRFKRRKSSIQCAKVIVIEYSSCRNRSNKELIRAGNRLTPIINKEYSSSKGETLIHLSARLAHENILKRLIQETSYATRLTNDKGQTPLLCAIQASSSSTATFLMDIDPLTITVCDNDYNSVYHYACYLSNDIVLSRALILIKRLNSHHEKIQALTRLIEENKDGKTAFLLSIEKGSVRCNRLFLSNNYLLNNSIDMSLFLNSKSVRCAIDNHQIDIVSYWLSDWNCFEILLNIYICSFNILEYSIEYEKNDFIRLFICQHIPLENIYLKKKYKNFLNHFNKNDGLTPIQRLLKRNNLVHLVPFILDQFILDNNRVDLSIIDDCLYNCPRKNQSFYGFKDKSWSIKSWLNQHPLSMIAQVSHNSIDDHLLVHLCVDLKYQLFGNILYFLIACGQIIYVTLYTSIVISSPTPSIQSTNYYSFINNTCNDICFKLSNHEKNPLQSDKSILRIFRILLIILSCLTLFKEIFQIITDKNKYFKKLFINLLEIHMYISGIIYGLDLNECTRRTGIRCHIQWETGAIGLLSVWTSLLLVLMQGIKFGKHGLLFITVLLSFLKLISFYIFIWIGYYLALYILLKDIFPQFTSFYFIPKLLVMFIGEFDLNSTFFPNNEPMKGSEGALLVFSAFIFTMFIVMSNIMGGLAVADVKEFRLNAKREHLRARIETILHLQSKFGFICEYCSKLMIKIFQKFSFIKFLFKYNILKLNIINTDELNIEIIFEKNLLKLIHSNKREKFNENYFIDQLNFIIKKQNQLKEYFEDSTLRTHNQLRRIVLQLHTQIEDLKRYFDQIFLN